GVVDLVARGPTRALFMRVMGANLASIMPQAVAAWCSQEGHDVAFLCYTGSEDLLEEIPADADLGFVGAFTEAAQTAYALSGPRPEQPVPRARGGHGAGRSPRPLLPPGRPALLRLRAGLHRPDSRPRGPGRLRAAPARRRLPVGPGPARRPAVAARALALPGG